MARLEEGQQAPDFTLDTIGGGKVSLSEELAKADKGVIVYFYPKAMTPGCTTQACDFRDSENSFKSAGYSVIGVSPDSIASLEKFVEKENLNFPLASDPSKEMLTEWGAYGEKKNYGRIVRGVIRSTIIVAKDGTVAKALYNVKATGHVARIRKELGID
ncbi:thioredoxin-dependent thiol peroxidase [Arcanobacterium pinnipediorum]|uniref:thioredoxin-dependent peroxiredoxin n=1 Tax=Arcanobacterium pinnipediorum TaxID=1503041 RepID=A0ABY5AF84_9ACTO|nr:thioredoxin-dependent thiol peroxidase [Arcanobacterium pinnipediorum]USR78858.1 thioredoxin-dependent thiol peroxidase [Arcanobacterium pinnipediorum]